MLTWRTLIGQNLVNSGLIGLEDKMEICIDFGTRFITFYIDKFTTDCRAKTTL